MLAQSDIMDCTCIVSLFCFQNAHGIIDARESSISNLEYDLFSEQDKVKELRKQMPSLESRLKGMVDELKSNQHSLEEKTATIQQMRRQLKQTRDKNLVRISLSERAGSDFNRPRGLKSPVIVPSMFAVC